MASYDGGEGLVITIAILFVLTILLGIGGSILTSLEDTSTQQPTVSEDCIK